MHHIYVHDTHSLSRVLYASHMETYSIFHSDILHDTTHSIYFTWRHIELEYVHHIYVHDSHSLSRVLYVPYIAIYSIFHSDVLHDSMCIIYVIAIYYMTH